MKLKRIIIGIFLTISIFFYDINVKALTRKELEDRVVSTAISYLNNNIYTDYDQFAMDASTKMTYKNSSGTTKTATNVTVNWRTTNVSPEEMSRTNIFSIDCSSFTSIVYKYSLGYDFSEFFDVSEGIPYYSFDSKNNIFFRKTIKSASDINTRLSVFGRGLAGRYYIAAAAAEKGITGEATASLEKYEAIIENVEAGKKYTFDDDDFGVYLYRIKDFKKTTPLSNDKNMTQELKNAYEEMEKLLKPGDMINFLRRSTTTDENGKTKEITTGHSMLYVGDVFGTPGIIHSSGDDYYNRQKKLNSLSISDDEYSVRFDSLKEYLYDGRFHNGKITYIAVVRPINQMPKNKDGSFKNIDSKKTMKRELNGRVFEEKRVTTNSSSRTAFKWLRTEQYASAYQASINSKDFTEKSKEYMTPISQYNSVNEGDKITYNLFLENLSNRGYCVGVGGGEYNTQNSCKNNGKTWQTVGKNIKISGLTITATIPDNTTYVDCTGSCKKIDDKTIQWTNISLGVGKGKELSYTVKVSKGTNIVNNGMKIKYGNSTLQMGKLTTKVNPTLNKVNANKFAETLNQFKKAVAASKIKYGTSSTTSYLVPSDGSKASTFSSDGFVKNIYYNATGIKLDELDELSEFNVKNAVFNKDSQYDSYAKKTDSDISSLTNSKYININKMLVKGFYGGRYLKGNDNGDRVGRLRLSDLEFGDIIVVYSTSGKNIAGTSVTYLYLGNTNPTIKDSSSNNGKAAIENDKKGNFVRFGSGNKITVYNETSSTSAYQFFNELWSKDLFVVLRPTQLYGTTVKYSGSTISGKNLSVEYGTYKNLKPLTPTKEYTITLDYKDYAQNKTYTYTCENTCNKTEKGKSTFESWYKDSKYTDKITGSDTKLYKTTTHTIYPKWIKASFKLPKASVTGYHIDSWYSDKTYATKVGKAGASYSITETKTLYAKWNVNTYTIEYDANGGSGKMNPSTHTYNVSANLSENKFTKTGYVLDGWSKTKKGKVDFAPGKEVVNLSTKNKEVIKLYAVWKKAPSNVYEVKLNIKNGYADANTKSVKSGESVTFEIKPNKGYTKCQTDSSTQKIVDNKLTITNITQNTTINITCVGIKYTVIYHPNGGNGTMENSTHTYGKSQPLNPNKYKKTGYEFKGWDTAVNNKVKYKDEENVLNLTTSKNFNLYAVWSEKTYTIKYELNGGTLDNKVTSYRITTEDIKLGEPKKEGYKFKGWTTDNDNTLQKTVVIKKGSTGNKKYIANYEVGKYIVTYKSDKYGKITGITKETLTYKSTPSGTSKTINEGYKNLKWAVNVDVELTDGNTILAGNAITEEQIKKIVVKEDLVITAYHYAKKYKVTYKDGTNGKIKGISSEEVSYSSNLLGTKVKANQGYIFKAWKANKKVKLNNGKTINAGNEISDIKQIVISEDITLTPLFEAASYKIKYESDTNGTITGIKEETVKYPNKISSTQTMSIDDNYIFSYWVADNDVLLQNDKTISKGDPITLEEISQIVPIDDTTLTAIYKQNGYSVYYLNYKDIIITANPKELIGKDGVLSGPEVERDRWDKEIVYVSDKDVMLENGKIIKAGDPIKTEQLFKIKVSEDLNITPRYENDFKLIDIENINMDLILGIILAVLIAFTLIYILKTNPNNIK